MTSPKPEPTAQPASDDELFAEIAEQLRELRGRIDDLAPTGDGDPDDDQPGPEDVPTSDRYRLERRPDDTSAGRMHLELAAWVQWLVPTYQLADEVPPCWERHDAVCEELAGLWVAWAGAWSGLERSDQVVTWHSQLVAARDRLRTHLRSSSGCTVDRCGLDIAERAAAHQRWVDRYRDTQAVDGVRYRLWQTRAALRAPYPLRSTPPPSTDGRDGGTAGP